METYRVQTSEEITTLEAELLTLLNDEDQPEARRALSIAEADAEAEFCRKRDAGNWKRQSLIEESRPGFVPPGTPPPQDWAALAYAKTRLNAVCKTSLRALGNSRRPEGVLSYIERAIEALCKQCLEKLEPFEDLLINGHLRQYFRNATWDWLQHELSSHARGFETEAWRV